MCRSAWGVLYVLEVAAVMSLLQQNPGKEDYVRNHLPNLFWSKPASRPEA